MDKQSSVGSNATLSTWVAFGLILDALSLTILWMVGAALEPFSPFLVDWADVISFATVPFAVHALALPKLFRTDAKIANPLFAATSYVCVIAVVIPITILLAIGMEVLVFACILQLGLQLSILTYEMRAHWFLLVIPSVVAGLVVGGFIASFRQPLPSSATAVRMRSDVIGFASGAALASLSAAGLWDMKALFGLHPYFSAKVSIGLIAYLPHLILTGQDMLRPTPLNPPPATSAFGEAPNAPSR